MKRRLHTLAIAATSLIAVAAHAQGAYGEVGYSQFNLKQDSRGFDTKVKPTAVRAIVGVELAPHLAIEGHAATGLKDDSVRIGSASATGEVDNMLGAFVKPKVMLGNTVELYGRAGVASTKVSTSAFGAGDSDRTTSFAYGGGASFSLTPQLSLNADYMNYLDRRGTKVDGVTFGVGFKF
jgi:attachment invasion locus protein